MEAECRKVILPDDMFIGYVVNGLLGVTLHESLLLHSHIEKLKKTMKNLDLAKQVF